MLGRVEHTKRQIVVITTIFNFMGFVSPIVIQFKVLFQAMCVHKVGWDEGIVEPVEVTSVYIQGRDNLYFMMLFHAFRAIINYV